MGAADSAVGGGDMVAMVLCGAVEVVRDVVLHRAVEGKSAVVRSVTKLLTNPITRVDAGDEFVRIVQKTDVV